MKTFMILWHIRESRKIVCIFLYFHVLAPQKHESTIKCMPDFCRIPDTRKSFFGYAGWTDFAVKTNEKHQKHETQFGSKIVCRISAG